MAGLKSALRRILGFAPRLRVSVVVPSYNYARYIEDRLYSIDRQTVRLFEIIVLDDASTDDSVALIKAAAPRLRARTQLVCNPQNTGVVFQQWAKGASMARGELVWIAEADDLSDPAFLAHLVPAFADPTVVMAYSQSRQIGSEGEVRMETYQPYLQDVDAEYWLSSHTVAGDQECGSVLAVMNTIPNVSACLFRRETLVGALEAEGPDFGGLRVAGDWLIYLSVLSRGALHFCAETLNSHRFHDNSVTRSALKAAALVKEVGTVQQQARRRFNVQPAYDAMARAYLQRLYDFFGVASPDYPRVFDHPDFRRLED